MTNTPNFAMSYGAPSAPSAPMSAIGVVKNVEARVKAKKAGGTYTVNVATLDTGVEVDFGFKPCPARIGDTVSWVVQKSYGTNKFVADDPSAGSLAPAYPPRGAYVPPSAASTTPGAPAAGPSAYRAGYGKPFPLPRDHGDTAIIRQNALTNAIKLIELATGEPKLGSGGVGETVLSFSTIEEMEQRVIQTAYKFAAFSSGNLDAMLADDIAKSAAGK